MAWNLPKDQQANKPKVDSDPWTGGNKPKGQQQPPNLEELIRNFWQKWRGKRFSAPRCPITLFKWALAIIVLIWLALGFHYVRADSLSYVMRLGAYQGQLTPGWQWRAWGLYQVKSLPQPMVATAMAEVMTQDLNLAEVSVELSYRINDPQAYLFAIDSPEIALQSLIHSALQQTAGTIKLDVLLSEANPPSVLTHFSHCLQLLVDQAGLGVTIESVKMNKVAIPTALQELFNKMNGLYETQSSIKQKNNNYQLQVLPPAVIKADALLVEAKQYAKQAESKAQMDVAGFLALLPSYEKSPHLIKYRLYTQTMATLVGQSPTVVVDGKGPAPVISLAEVWSKKVAQTEAVEETAEASASQNDNNDKAGYDSNAANGYANLKGGYG